MSEIRDLTVPSVAEGKCNYEKYAYSQNITTNPMDYFHSSNHHYYFISRNKGFCLSSSSTYSNSSTERDGKKIYKFSRRIVVKRCASVVKRKIVAMAKAAFKLSIHSDPISREFKRSALLNILRKLRKRSKNILQNTLGGRNLLKLSVIFGGTKRRYNQVDKAGFIDGNSKQVDNTMRRKVVRQCRKLLMITYAMSHHVKQAHKKYITTIRLFQKPRKGSKKESLAGTKDEAKKNIPSLTPALFMGREPMYPSELNDLFNPSLCDLCNVNMNSPQAANRHYVSHTHMRRVRNWFHYKSSVNRVDIRGAQDLTHVCPPKNYCVLCTVKLPSRRHALQHYSGKRHRDLVLKSVQLKGIGYLDFETEKNRATATESSLETQCGFARVSVHDAMKPKSEMDIFKNQGVRNAHIDKALEPLTKKVDPVCPELKIVHATHHALRKSPSTFNSDYSLSAKTDTTGTQPSPYFHDGRSNIGVTSPGNRHSSEVSQSFLEAMTTLSCVTCNISATSRIQMLSHLKGARHLKKMKLVGETQKPLVTIAESLLVDNPKDMSIYRTPSGCYYCDQCKVTVSDENRMSTHIASKKHAKTLRELKGHQGV